MLIMKDRLYTRSHEWVLFTDDTTARIGLTDFAQDSMGGVVFVELPTPGGAVTVEESFAEVESVKAVSEVYSPVTGTVSAVDGELADTPERINSEPYEAWLIEVKDITARTELLSAEEYEALCAGEV